MASIVVPTRGLVLPPPALVAEPSQDATGLSQVIQLDLENGLLHELIRAARHGGRSPQLSFGKTIALHYGNKTRALFSTPSSTQSFLYTQHPDNSNDLTVAGQLSHNLFLQKLQESLTGSDEALAKLQNSLASHEQEKQSNKIKFLADSSSLPPPVKQTAASLKQQSSRASPLSLLRKENNISRHSTSNTRSMPSSPAVGPSRPPVFGKAHPTSAPPPPQGGLRRAKAIRQPLIHLLATRKVSTQYLAGELKCKDSDILQVLQKVGKESSLDISKWELKDQTFKDLDVWAFKYADPHDREIAIDRAISAFDRMRLSGSDPIWQKLLPKAERGKGKVLSRLGNLGKGPIQHSGTPRIHVQHTDDTKRNLSETENEKREHLAPSDAESRSQFKTQDSTKKSKKSEKEVQAKRLASKGPKKASSAASEKEAHPAAKKGGKSTTEALSNEFVRDSDEEDGLEVALAAQTQSSSRKTESSNEAGAPLPAKGVSSKVLKPKPGPNPGKATVGSGIAKVKVAKASSANQPNAIAKPKQQGTTVNDEDERNGNPPNKQGKVAQESHGKDCEGPSSTSVSHPTKTYSTQGDGQTTKSVSRSRKTSSPHKPSPLGSSPPTNASDFCDHDLSSASSTPLIAFKGRETATLNGVGSHVRNTSEHSLKRKTGDLDSNIHHHGSPLPNGLTNGLSSGYVKAAKRPRTGELTPPSSDNSSPPETQSLKVVALEKAEKFKEYYPRYAELYREVESADPPTSDQIEKLEKMHERLAEMKEEIVELHASMKG